MSVADLAVRISADIKELADAQKKIGKVATDLGNVGATLTKNVTLPLMALGGLALAAANNIDQAMDIIRGGTGATGEALQALEEDFKAVYRIVPQGAEIVGQAMADVATRTDRTGESLRGMTKTMLDLARVTGGDVSRIISETTRVFGDWSIATEDQESALDWLLKTSQATGVQVDVLATKLVQYGAPLRQLGFDFEIAAALMGKFEKEGVNAELVLGSMRIALSRMAQEGVTDAAQALQVMIERIKEAGSVGEANALALEMFGARAGPDMAAAIREGRFEVEELFALLNANTDTIAQAAEETLSFSEHMAILKNEATIALEPLGKVLLDLFKEAKPHMETAVRKFGELTQAFKDLDPETQGRWLKLFGALIALGPVVSVIASVAEGVGLLIGVLKFLAGPIGLALAVTAAFTGLSDKAREWTEGWGPRLNQAFTLLVAALGGPISGILGLIRNFDLLKTNAQNDINVVVGFFQSIPEKFEAAKEWVGNIITAIGEWFSSLPERIGDGLSAAGVWLVDFFIDKLPYWAGHGISALIKFFIDLPGNVWTHLTTVAGKLAEWAVVVGNWAREAGSKLVTNFINWVKELPGNVWTWLVQTAQKIPVWGGQLWTYATLAAGRLVSGIMTAINNLPGQIWDVMVSAAKKLLDIGSTFYNYAKKAAENAWKGFKAGLGIKSPSLIEKALFAIQDTARETIGMMQHDFGSLSRLQVPVNIAMAGAGAGTVTVNHTGTLRVEGVNDKGQLVGFVNIFMDTLDKSPTLRRKISEASGRNYRDITRGQGG